MEGRWSLSQVAQDVVERRAGQRRALEAETTGSVADASAPAPTTTCCGCCAFSCARGSRGGRGSAACPACSCSCLWWDNRLQVLKDAGDALAECGTCCTYVVEVSRSDREGRL